MNRINCWEFMKCGREPNGLNADKLGICPVTQFNKFNSINNGKYAGRFCWTIAGTFCDGVPSGTYSEKFSNCLKCSFLIKVNEEESRNFILTPDKKAVDL